MGVNFATHAVENQAPPLAGYDAFNADAALVDAVRREGGGWAHDELQAYGLLAGGELAVLGDVRLTTRDLPEPLRPPPWPTSPAGDRIRSALAGWAEACPRPLVIFVDEIDALRDAVLLSVLRQLRAGYRQNP